MSVLHICIAVLGAVTGSFLNICIYRIPAGEPIIKTPSHCRQCNTRLKPLDLIPFLSFILLRGHCRYCGVRISPRYVIVEIITSLLYVLTFLKYGMSIEFLAAVYLLSILIAVFFTDLEHKIIPDEYVLAGLGGGVLLIIYNLFREISFYGDRMWWNPLLGCAVGVGFLLFVAIIGYIIYKSDEAMGMGDVKIMAPIGIFLGWKLTIVSLLTAVVSGGIISILLLILRILNRKDTIPFGPFIVIGTCLALLWGWDIINYYVY